MKIYQDLNYTKKWPKTFEVLKKSQNFVKSGHVVDDGVTISSQAWNVT